MKNRVVDIAEVRAGYAFRERIEARVDGSVAVVQMKDIDDANQLRTDALVRVHLPGVRDAYLLRPGDLLFRSRGMRNTASLVTKAPERTIAAAPILLVRVTDPSIDPVYLQWFINQPSIQLALADLGEGTYAKTISKAALEQIEVPVPTARRQRQIVELAVLMSREQSLMHQLAAARKRMVDGILWRCAQDTRQTPG